MIDHKLIVDNAPAYIGTVRINHSGCPAGADTRRRLYLTRKPDLHTVLAFCHNCGDGGCATEIDRLMFAPLQTAEERDDKTMPDLDLITSSGAAMTWLSQYGLEPKEWDNFKLGYDPDSGRVVLPVYSTVGITNGDYSYDKLLGYQARLVHTRAYGPKYLTCKFSDTDALECTIGQGVIGAQNVVVIVEDMLSAIKVHRVASIVVPLFGTHIRSERVLDLCKHFPVVVWLDNDNPDVLHKAARMVSLVRAFGGRANKVPENYKDPKQYSTHDIGATLQYATKGAP